MRKSAVIISSTAIAITVANLLYPIAQIFPATMNHLYIWLTIILGPGAVIAMAVAGYWLTIYRQKVNYKDLIIITAGFAIVTALPWITSSLLEPSFTARRGPSSLLPNLYTIIVNFSFGLVGVYISYHCRPVKLFK